MTLYPKSTLEKSQLGVYHNFINCDHVSWAIFECIHIYSSVMTFTPESTPPVTVLDIEENCFQALGAT